MRFRLRHLGFFGRLLQVLALLVALGVVQWIMSAQTGDWVMAEGEIIRSETRSHRVGDEDLYYLSLSYRYPVGGDWYDGQRVTLAGGYGSRFEELVVDGQGPAWLRWWWRRVPLPGARSHDELAGVAGQYPAGARVPVYHDPDDPRNSALIPRTDRAWFRLALVVFLVGLALLPLVWGVRAARRAVAWATPPPDGCARLLGVIGFLGFLLVVWSYRQARQAEQPPQPALLAELCSEDPLEPRWVSLPSDYRSQPVWSETGLAEPRHARCPQSGPVELSPETSRTQLLALQGCRIALVEPDVTEQRLLDFGVTRYVDAFELGRYQRILGTGDAGRGVWLLSHRFASPEVQDNRRRWEGRLIRVAQLPKNRTHFRREWSEVSGALSGREFVVLSDRATPVESGSLHLFGDCAVALLESGQPESSVTMARVRRNRREWPDAAIGAQRPVLLEVPGPDRYKSRRTAAWNIVQMLGWSLVLFGLVPVLLSGYMRLTGGAGARPDRR